MLTVILSHLIEKYRFVFPLDFIVLAFQALNKPKMGLSLRDVTVTLKTARKNKKNIFLFLNRILSLQENICLTLLPKNSHGDYTAAYTILSAQLIYYIYPLYESASVSDPV